MPKAVFTITHAVTADQIAADVAAVQTKLDRARALYADQLARYRAAVPACTDELVAAMEQRGATPIQSMYSLLSPYHETQNQARALKFAQDTKPRAATIDIAVIDSFDVKDRLKAAGYRFNRDGYWVDFAGLNVKAAWCKTIKPAAIESTIAELTAIGCELIMDGAINTAVANIKANIAGA